MGNNSKENASESPMESLPSKNSNHSLGVEHFPDAYYKKDDFIGQRYEVYGVLGMGGFGVVYLVYCHETSSIYALKTFRDEYLADTDTRNLFQKEAHIWVELQRHPYLVRAHFVDEIAGRLYIAMEYIASEEEGLNTLEGYLRYRPPDLAQSLRWGIQFCHGMEYAYSKGIRAHRDIKPANIMINQDRTIKISDFGLAGVLSITKSIKGIRLSIKDGRIGLSGQTMEGRGFGTPTHMSPEQYIDAAGCDERSDIYAFGVVLYQMISDGNVPFLAPLPNDSSEIEMHRFWIRMYRLHKESAVPKLKSPLFPIILKCLEKEKNKRYQNFRVLRNDLEILLKQEIGEVVRQPEMKELEDWEWHNRGTSFSKLGRYEEALRCYNHALAINPRDAYAWNNKGVSLSKLGRYEESLRCYNQALEINPQYAYAWNNKGLSLHSMGSYEEALRCYDQALAINPRDAYAWNNKGNSFSSLGLEEETLCCYDQALSIVPRYAEAWNNKGVTLASLKRYEEALLCYDQALAINPRYAYACNNKGVTLDSLKRYEEAILCYDQALAINPQYAEAGFNKGLDLASLGRHEEALRYHDQALEINPRDAEAWYNKAISEDHLEKIQDATRSYQKFLALALPQHIKYVEYTRKRLQELEKK